MSNIIFRTINGIVRPITISGHTAKIKKRKQHSNLNII